MPELKMRAACDFYPYFFVFVIDLPAVGSWSSGHICFDVL